MFYYLKCPTIPLETLHTFENIIIKIITICIHFVNCVKYGLYQIWYVLNMVCIKYGMYQIWYVLNMVCIKYGMY